MKYTSVSTIDTTLGGNDSKWNSKQVELRNKEESLSWYLNEKKRLQTKTTQVRDRKRHFTVIKGKIHQKDNLFLNICISSTKHPILQKKYY